MMLLEYAVWGSWASVAGKYFTDPAPRGLGFPGAFSGLLFSLLPLAAILSPVLIGQLADKWVRAERLQGVLCILCSGVLFALAGAREEGHVLWLMLAYAMLFAPTTTLTNAIAFAHLQNAAREFGPVRVGGTIGWFIALACLAGWRFMAGGQVSGDIFYLASAFSLVLGIYSFFLPATPPQHVGAGLPFVKALSLFKDRNFTVFAICSFALGLTLDFYYIFGSAFIGTPAALAGVGVSARDLPMIMMLPQVSEIIIMATLGATLPRLGVKRALLIGFGCWILRFAIFSALPTIPGAAVALLLHGFCFTFVFAVASLYIHEIAAPAIRASAQALVTIGLFGFGRFFGSQFAGLVHDGFARKLVKPVQIEGTLYREITDWPVLFLVPLGIAFLSAVALSLLFREAQAEKAS
jgi:nucleoside transporter